ncbi:condensin complex subunit 2/barren [Gilbertella persicaria]|uniref:condensin complex subunit 2/barren n=1 Tax=Gilbertella persicaria TaxID=101096 RepID=UPI0022202AA4|nr:condensin complex subunit 2/barren [Gilbertella persicaria]KAI8076555.1 condensin complex subunit 2/barren [Gilbertella persicaria]
MNEQEKEEHSEQKEEEEEKDDPMEIDKQVDKQEEPRVEIFRLKAKLPKMEALSDFHIVPFLKDYDFFSETDNSIPDLDLDEEDEEVLPMDDIPQEDNFQFDDFDYGVDDMDPFEDENTQFPKTEPELDFTKESKPHEDDFLSAFISNGNNEMFDYFDSTFSKNWAGLGHWKLKKPIKRTKPVENNDKPAQKKKTRADQFRLAFDEVEEEGPDDQIFEHYTKRPTMSKEITAKMTGHSLPDDINFSSKLLLQYALKPALYFKKTKHKKLIEQENTDIDFWADQTQDFMDEPDYTNDDFDMPIDDTQLDTKYDDASFYHDNDENDPEMSELYGDELITNHTLKKTRPLYVNYARTAKRVDVKKLKDNLWKVLTQEQEKVSGEQKFTDIVHHLKKMYPPKTMRDISVPFCFICLLHLANEKDLSIQGPIHNDDDDDDFVLGEQAWMNNESILNEVTIIQN